LLDFWQEQPKRTQPHGPHHMGSFWRGRLGSHITRQSFVDSFDQASVRDPYPGIFCGLGYIILDQCGIDNCLSPMNSLGQSIPFSLTSIQLWRSAPFLGMNFLPGIPEKTFLSSNDIALTKDSRAETPGRSLDILFILCTHSTSASFSWEFGK
jgi:hypothetical protein